LLDYLLTPSISKQNLFTYPLSLPAGANFSTGRQACSMIAKGIHKSNIKNSSQSEDIFLWAAFRHGGKDAFEALYHLYIDQLYNYGMHIILDRTVVEDSIQDLFLELWQRRKFLGDTDGVKFYLYKCLKRKILRKLKARENAAQRCHLTARSENEVSESWETEAIVKESRLQTAEVLSRALEGLPERQREIIVYRFYHDLSPRQISSVMSLTIEATYTLLSRALHSLKNVVQERYPLFVLFMYSLGAALFKNIF
jgi:RNA polymerase sigma-70 factor (ECF subfamily)